MTTDFRALCAELVDIATAHCNPDDSAVGYCAAVLTRARAELAQPEPVAPADKEVTELVAWLRDRANSTSLALTARHITRAADLLERLASDNAGLAAAADSLYADNMSLLDNHHG
jgi:hypothetical protein